MWFVPLHVQFARSKCTVQVRWRNASKLLVAHNGSSMQLVDVSGGKMVLVTEHLPLPRNEHFPVICYAQPHTVLFDDGDDASPTRYLLYWINICGPETILQLLLVRGHVAEALDMVKHPQGRCALGWYL